VESRAYSIAEACAIAGIRRTTLYNNIRAGKLRAIKIGSRTLILAPDLYRWLDGMPPLSRPTAENVSERSVTVHSGSDAVSHPDE
jgi:excisionase family DNA binding protein